VLYESIKNKNFLNIFNSLNNENDVNQLLSELRNIPSDYFTSYEHYMFYKRYVLPKLRLVSKEYDWKSTISRYKVYRIKHKLLINVSDIYMVMKLTYDIYYRYKIDKNGEYRHLDSRDHSYVIGFDTNGKLFINEIPNMFLNYKVGMIKNFDGKGVEVRVVDREEVIRLLGFEHDTADKELIEITGVGLYRVQGEIVLNVIRGLESIGEFYRSLLNRSGITSYAEMYFMNYVALSLIDLGFSIDTASRVVLRNILHSDIIRNSKKVMKILEVLGNSIIEQLKRYMEIYAVSYGRESDTFTNTYILRYYIVSNLGTFELKVSFNYFRPRPFQLPYSDIEVDVRAIHDLCKLCKEIENEFIDTLRNTPRQSYKMLIGNHIIELKNVYSGDIIFRPSRRLEIELFRLPSITNNINAYYVDSESEIVISHREHGNTVIRFSKPFLVNFTTTTILNNYPDKLNRIVLENLVNGFNNNRKVIEYLDSYGDMK
jgi:hypothetical protein